MVPLVVVVVVPLVVVVVLLKKVLDVLLESSGVPDVVVVLAVVVASELGIFLPGGGEVSHPCKAAPRNSADTAKKVLDKDCITLV